MGLGREVRGDADFEAEQLARCCDQTLSLERSVSTEDPALRDHCCYLI